MSTSTLAIVLLVVLAAAAVVRFERLCLNDLNATSDLELRHFTRQGWSALIILAIPIGGILYLYAGKDVPPAR